MGGGFRQLQVWQRGKALAVELYRLTSSGPFSSDFGLRDQLRRAAVSVCSNIAEGDARQTDRESVQFFFIAKGSLAELSAQLDIALEVHSLSFATVAPLLQECEAISAMLQAIITHRRQ
ncbi:MAG TPA: four helix bundle protein [Opitutaceae bacterium]|nr:four helix bundle protein [Opitutaceae bacterium]